MGSSAATLNDEYSRATLALAATIDDYLNIVSQPRLRLLLLLLLLQLWLHVGVACQQLPRVCTRTRLRPGGCACCLPAA
jgi:hypothetical protein